MSRCVIFLSLKMNVCSVCPTCGFCCLSVSDHICRFLLSSESRSNKIGMRLKHQDVRWRLVTYMSICLDLVVGIIYMRGGNEGEEKVYNMQHTHSLFLLSY